MDTQTAPIGDRPAPPPADEPPVVLATHELTKSFGNTLAVDHLSLSVRRGDVFGFLGPNGAGKTTTIRMIVGLIYPTSGYAEVLDHQVPRDKEEALRHIGGFVEVPAFYGNMSARKNLRLMGSLNGQVDGGAHRRGARHRRPARARRLQGRRLLARHEAAPRHRQRAHQRTRARDPRRAHQRPRPAGHEGRARAGARARRRRHHGLPLLAPAARGRAGLQPRRDHQQGPGRGRGPGERAAPRALGGQGPHLRPGQGARGRRRAARRPARSSPTRST